MALPASGPLDGDQIHVEAGGTTATAASMQDADILALISKSAGVAGNMAEWYGASAQGIGADWPDSDTQISTIDLAAAYAYMTFGDDGKYDLYQTINTFNQEYLTSPDADEGDNFWIKWNHASGSLNYTNMTKDTYYQLSAERYMGMFRTTVGISELTDVTVTIAEDSGGTGAVNWTGDFKAQVTL